MKKIVLLFLCTITFIGCENDDTDFIVGRWKVAKVMINTATTSLSECDMGTIYEFRKDKNLWLLGPQMTNNGELCMFTGFDPNWNKSSSGYQITGNQYVLADVSKVSKDTIVIQNINGYTPGLKKILVRQ